MRPQYHWNPHLKELIICCTEIKNSMGKIRWIASYPKSGNTWIRVFLSALLTGSTKTVDINSLGTISKRESSRLWGSSSISSISLAKKPATKIDRMSAHLNLANLLNENEFVKTHNMNLNRKPFRTINPLVTDSAIYIMRNPLDVVVSLSRHNNSSIDDAIRVLNTSMYLTKETESTVAELRGSWSENVESWVEESRFPVFLTKYENLLSSTDEFHKLVNFLQIRCNKTQTIEAAKLSEFENLKQQEKTKGFVERPECSERFFHTGTVGQWKNSLTPQQIDRVVTNNYKVMKIHSYLP